MSLSNFLFLLVVILAVFSCKQEKGKYQMVQLNQGKKASDDIYIRYLTDQIDRFPEEEDNYIKLAALYKKHAGPVKAIKLLERAERNNPKNIAILLGLAELYLEEENIGRLSESLKTVRQIDPENMKFLKLSAGYALLLRDYTNAIFFANRAMLANPYDDDNYYLRGSAQLVNRDSLNALISFEEANKLKNSYKNFSKIFDVALALGDTKKAKTYLDEFSGKNTEENLCYEWGTYFNRIGRMDTSIRILSNCLQTKPLEERTKLELAIYYNRINNVDSTLWFVNQYLESNPKGTKAYVLKAKTLEKINFYTEAKKLYIAALEIDSTSILAQRGLENLERKVAYLRLVKRKEEIQRQVEIMKPLNSKVIN